MIIAEKRKNTKGITLVALVVTIVVLIILATISINIIFGEDGILESAKWAGYVTEYESVAEAIELYRVEQELNKYGEEKVYKLASTSTSIAKNSEEGIYPINLQEIVESSSISETLKRTIINYEGLKSTEISDTEKVNLYKVDFSKIKVNVKKEYVINIVNGNLYSIQYEEYKKNIYHTPRMGVGISAKMTETGTYEIIVDAGDIVSWDSIQMYYEKIVEGSLECKVFTSDDEIEWKEASIELGSSEEKEEKYNILEADSTQYLKVQVEIKEVNGKNTKVDYIMVNFYKYRDTEIVPEITVEGEATKQGDVYSIPTSSNGQVEATGTATVTQKIEVPKEEGEYLLKLEDTYGKPNTTVTITKADGTKEEIEMPETNKISVPAGSTIEIKSELQAGDGVGKVEILKKDSELSQKTIEDYTTSSGQTSKDESNKWITVEQNKYVYNNGGTGYWEKCLVNDTGVDETGIIIESEDSVKRIKITYQTSSDGKTWSSSFTNIQDARNTQYLKVIVEYQVIQGNEYGDTSNNKIKVILNDGSWKATFVDEDGTELFKQYAYFTSSEMTGSITLPNYNNKEGKTFIGWKLGDNAYEADETYTLTKDETFTAVYAKTDIYTKEDLIAFREYVNKGYSFKDVTVRVMDDIDLNEGKYTVAEDGTVSFDSDAEEWTPIGNYAADNTLTFKGTFNGNNKIISNLYINSTSDYQGLFGYSTGGNISNVILRDINITGNNYVGGVVGYLINGESENVQITNCIITESTEGIGKITGAEYVGGISGNTVNATILNCGNNINIESTIRFGGGIVGYAKDLEIIGAYNKGNVNGGERIGGISGVLDGENSGSCSITYCYNTGTIAGNYRVGGIAGQGYDYARVYNCYNTGDICATDYIIETEGFNYARTGGIVGVLSRRGIIMYSYNLGSISNENIGMCVGGIVGQSSAFDGLNQTYDLGSTVQFCYNTGNIISNVGRIGGIVGENVEYSSVKNCYVSSSVVINRLSVTPTQDHGESPYWVGKIIGIENSMSSDYVSENVVSSNMPDVYHVVNSVVNGTFEGESEYWSKNDLNAPKLLWEK